MSKENEPFNTYAESFKTRIDLLRDLARDRNRGIDDFLSLLSSRLECETKYGVALDKIGKTSQKLNKGYFIL